MTSDALVAQGLTISSPASVLVRGAGLRLRRGRCLGIIGESGSGKTLTLRSLMGLLPEPLRVDSGTVDVDLDGSGPRTVRDPAELCGHGVSMVFQDPLAALDPSMRVGQFVGEVVAHASGVSRRQARTTVPTLLAEVGFRDPDRIAQSFPHQISNGQRQRVVLAIALASDPKVLLCDEATSALDVTTQAQIVQLLNDLRAKRGLSVVFVTHDLAVARQSADDIVVMFSGRVMEVGDIDSVLDKPRHPYTRTLIEAYSTGEADPATSEAVQPGHAADAGCPFRWRCAEAVADCATTQRDLDPVRVRVGSGCIRDERESELWNAG